MTAEYISSPVALLAFAIILSMGVERLMEIWRAYEKYCDARSGSTKKWDQRAEKIKARIEKRLDHAKYTNRDNFFLALAFVSRFLSPSTPESGNIIAISANELRTQTTKKRYLMVSVTLGIALAFIFDIDMFSLVGTTGEGGEIESFFTDGLIEKFELDGFAKFMTGVAIGMGSGPLHKIIVALERSRNSKGHK